MTHAILMEATGGPEVLTWTEVPDPKAGEGEIVVRHTAVGLNYIDTYFRSGLYPAPKGLPMVIGNEAAGVVEEVGPGVDLFRVGDRVAYASPIGAYTERRAMPAASAVKVPDGIDDKTAAAMMLKGMTVRYLLRETFRVGPSTTLLFHAAAGGVGLIAGQWAKALGARVIGTASTPEKMDLALRNGYDHVINYKEADFVHAVKEFTGGNGVDVVYDSVGKTTYPGSLDCLKPFGTWVSFGQASGPIENFKLQDLAQKGSLYATRPTLFTYVATRERLDANAGELFEMVASGTVTINVEQTFPLKEAAEAHRALEGRRTTGATVLVPDA
jgi:NADPH2:quinone reductase